MTVRLLAPYPYKSYITIPAGAVVGIFSAADEAGLIASKYAEASAGPVTWTPPNEAPTPPGSTIPGPVAVSGVLGTGNLLTATLASGWTVTGYQWTRDGVNISGATSSTYMQVGVDENKTIALMVSGLAYSARAGVVPASPFVALLRTVSPYNRVGTSVIAASGSAQRIAGRANRPIGSGDVAKLRVRADNIIFKSNSTVVGSGGAFTILNCFIEIGSTSVRVTWGGSNTRTMADGEYDVYSDPVLPSAFALSAFARNLQTYIRYEVEAADGSFINIIEGTDETAANGKQYNPAATTCNNISGTGGLTFTGTAPSTSFGCPLMLVGEYVNDDERCFGLVGDSIFAQGNRRSYGVRPMYSDSANYLSAVQVGRVGGQSSIQTAYETIVGTFTKLFNVGVEEYGTNNADSAVNVAALQTLALNSWAFLRRTASTNSRAKSFKIVRPWLLMKTTSTDSWATTANQTPLANWGSGGFVEQLNDWYSTQIGVGNGPDVVCDPCNGAAGTVRGNTTKGNADYYNWVGGYVNDGLHPLGPASNTLGDNLKPYLTAIT